MNKELYSILINDVNVELWIKVLVILYWYDKYNRRYIPNQLLENRLKAPRRSIQRALGTLESRGYIKIWYHYNKRYFSFINKNNGSVFNYDWLNDSKEESENIDIDNDSNT